MEYIRFVSGMSRWDGSMNLSRPNAGVCGDAITDLKTTNNELSIWLVDNENQIDEVAAVIALERYELDKVCYVKLDKRLIENILTIKTTKGRCKPIIDQSILDRHRDIEGLDSKLLETLSSYMLQQVQQSNFGNRDRMKMKTIINDMIQNKQIDEKLIKENIKKDL